MRLRWVIVAAVIVIVVVGVVVFMQQRARMERVQKAQLETALRDNLAQLRKTIEMFHKDNGRYPHSLNELVPNYLRKIPPDPMTGSASWRLTTEETVQVSDDFSSSTAPKSESVIIDVHSSAPGYGDY